MEETKNVEQLAPIDVERLVLKRLGRGPASALELRMLLARVTPTTESRCLQPIDRALCELSRRGQIEQVHDIHAGVLVWQMTAEAIGLKTPQLKLSRTLREILLSFLDCDLKQLGLVQAIHKLEIVRRLLGTEENVQPPNKELGDAQDTRD